MLIEELLDIVLYLILRPAILALGLVHRHHAPPHPALHILRPELDGV